MNILKNPTKTKNIISFTLHCLVLISVLLVSAALNPVNAQPAHMDCRTNVVEGYCYGPSCPTGTEQIGDAGEYGCGGTLLCCGASILVPVPEVREGSTCQDAVDEQYQDFYKEPCMSSDGKRACGLTGYSPCPYGFWGVPSTGATSKICESIEENTGRDLTYIDIFKSCMDFGAFLNAIINWGIALAGLAALFRLVIGGIQYIFALGNPDSLAAAHDTITYAILGLLVVVCAYLIMKILAGAVPEEWSVWFGIPRP